MSKKNKLQKAEVLLPEGLGEVIVVDKVHEIKSVETKPHLVIWSFDPINVKCDETIELNAILPI